MHFSKYNITIEDFPFVHGVTIYNLITKGLIFLNSKAQIKQLEDIDSDSLEEMREYKMIFDSQQDEIDFVKNTMSDKYQTDKKLEVTVVTSHDCNLRCSYCFEGKSHNEKMKIKKAQDILEDIYSFMNENKDAEVAIRYYGGEPMTNLKIIEYINDNLQAKYSSKFSFSLVSNGVLITSDIIKSWEKYNWSGIKITLDGDKEFNDSRRISKDGESTYDRIMQCLINLPSNIEIFLHIVVDDSNIDHLDNMFQDLASNALQQKIVIGISYTHPHINVAPEKRAQTIVRVAKKVKQYGFFLSNLISIDGEGICPNKNHNAYLVDIDGRKFKCTGFMSMKECSASIYRGTADRYINEDIECLKCKYLPVCNGGCQFLKSYNNNKKYCQKKYFDILIPQLLKLCVDYEFV